MLFKTGVVLFLGYLAFVQSEGTGRRSFVKTLLDGYDIGLRPSCEGEEKTIVNMDIAPRQILNLDEPTQQLTMNVWMRFNWNDCQLRWNATEQGIGHMILTFDRLWKPDITLYDSSAGEGFPDQEKYRIKLFSDGVVQFNFPTIITSLCKLNVEHFPFDEQRCRLSFGSWSYHGGEIDIYSTNPEGDLAILQENAEWVVKALPAKRKVTSYDHLPDPYVDITYHLVIQRRPLYYTLNLLFPCILVTAVTFLGFLLPVEAGERISLQITVMLALSVFMLMISENLPPSSDSAPILGLYFSATMGIVGLSCLVSVIVINLHFKEDADVPIWIQKHLLRDKDGSTYPAESIDIGKGLLSHEEDGFVEYKRGIPDTRKEDNSHESITTRISSTLDSLNANETLKKQLDKLQRIHKYFEDLRKDKERAGKWRRLGILIDRVCLALFLLLTVIITVAVFVTLNSGRD